MAVITSVEKRSPAARAGIRAGDDFLRLNGHRIRDVFDLKFYSYEPEVSAEIIRDGEALTITVKKREGEPLGIEFESYLIDTPHSCANKCIFCFIDQMPPGMRETLYFKDDDARLSFLQGNYVTLTNLLDADIQRIIDMRISPINISVHTTNPELRVKMLKNRRAGECLKYLKNLADGGVSVNAQIVLCPDWNDGDEFLRTITDLAALSPAVQSVSVVPIGLTKYRDGLEQVRPVKKADALEIIRTIDGLGNRLVAEGGSRTFYCSDELYITAELLLPSVEYYEDFPQIENGVGMTALFIEEATDYIADLDENAEAASFTLVTGELFYPILSNILDALREKCNNICGSVIAIKNEFFGETITIAGLVTGGDLINQLRGKELGDRLIIPSAMLRSGEEVFLDDVTVADVERGLGVSVLAGSGATELIDLIFS